MHLLKGQAVGVTGGEEPVDLQQSPADMVILSAADTEISGLAAARRVLGADFPSLRLANWMQLAHPYSIDLYGETVLAKARIVVVRLLGGGSYWRYGLEETVRLARANGTKLVVVPGDAAWDEALAAEGTIPTAQAQKLWSYLVEGGSTNLANALRFAAHLIGEGEDPPPAEVLPSAGFYAAPSRQLIAPEGRGKDHRQVLPSGHGRCRVLPRAAASRVYGAG
jgi:cobaltochelatase CobN